MDRQQLSRLGGASGVIFLLLIMAGFGVGVLADRPPDDAPPAVVGAVLLASAMAYECMGLLLGLASLALLVFAGGLRGCLLTPAGETESLATLSGTAAAFWAFLWLLAGLFVGSAPGMADYNAHAEGATTLLRLVSLPVNEQGPLVPALCVGATALAARRTRVFPAWYCRGSALLAPLLLLASTLSVFGLAFPMLPIGLMLWLVWIATTSAMMYCAAHPAQCEQPTRDHGPALAE